MIVDDEIKITEVLEAYLKNAGYQTKSVHSGQKAIEAAEELKPDLIILDLMLPDIMGEDVCQMIHQKQDIPIIMLTAKIEENNMVRGLQIGADDYIVKPFSPRNVLARVETVLRRTQKRMEENKQDVVIIGNHYITVDFTYRKVEKQGRKSILHRQNIKFLNYWLGHQTVYLAGNRLYLMHWRMNLRDMIGVLILT